MRNIGIGVVRRTKGGGGVPAPTPVYAYDPNQIYSVDYEFTGGGRAYVGGVLYNSLSEAYAASAAAGPGQVGYLYQDAVNGDFLLLPAALTEFNFTASGVNSNPAGGTGVTQYLMSIDDNGVGTTTDNLGYVAEQNPAGTVQLRQSISSASVNYSSFVANAPTKRGVRVKYAGKWKSGQNRWYYNGRYNGSDSVANFPAGIVLIRFGNGLSNTRRWLGALGRYDAWPTTQDDDMLLGRSALNGASFLNCSYSWWIKNQCEIRNGIMYLTGAGRIGTNAVGTAGRQFMAAININTGLLVGYKTLYTNYVMDDHNAAGFKFLSNGSLFVQYPPHNDDGVVRARISADGTVNGLGAEFLLPALTEASYAQLHDFGANLMHFARDTVNAWSVMRSTNYGADGSWTKYRNLFSSVLQCYTNTTKIGADLIRAFIYDHPEFGDNKIRMCEIVPSTGDVVSGAGTLGNLYDGSPGAVADYASLSIVFAPPAGSCVRLLDVSDDGNKMLLWQSVNGAYGAGTYKLAYYNGGDRFNVSGWTVRDIGAAGASFANPATTYIGGACFARVAHTGTRIYVSQESGGTWTIKCMETDDNGLTWDTVETLATSSTTKLIRPASPIGAVDRLPVIWQDGDYTTYTDFLLDTKWPYEVPTYDIEAEALFSDMNVAPDNVIKKRYNDLIVALKMDGIWPKVSVLHVLCAHDDQAMRLDIKGNPAYTLVNIGNPVFTPFQGVQGDGVDDALDTGFQFDASYQDNAHMQFFSLTDGSGGVSGAAVEMGNDNSTLVARNSVNQGTHRLNSATAATNYSSPDGRGHFLTSRTGSAAADNPMYRNGAVLAAASGGVSQAVHAVNMRYLGRSGTTPTWSVRKWAFAGYGRGLTATEVQKLYTRLRKFALDTGLAV